MSQITEWTFVADVVSWINQILEERKDLPYSRAQVELRKKGKLQRRDLTLYDRQNKQKIVLTGEVKLPDKPDGRNPFQDALVLDAHGKADDVGAEYFITWNVNRCVLWRTFKPGTPITERYIEPYEVLPAPIRKSDELLHPRVQEQIKQFLVRFLERFAAIVTGAEPMVALPLDEKFIVVWEYALEPLVFETLDSINTLYNSDKKFTDSLNKWMRDDQGWIISKDEGVIRENLQSAAKFSCYVLANKIIFYKALRRRFTRMRALKIPKSITTGKELRELLEAYFQHAIETSKDYQTVFKGDFGDNLPFLSDEAVESWRDLTTQTDAFDFTQINYEIMGLIFERMLSPAERHKYGQHYTRSEVVDLINSFCIRNADATVLDAACGGGTFLVRAYQRKSDLSKKTLSHQDNIRQLYGLDISAYPVHLTTINLATRDLIESANYPFVVRNDFFKIKPGDAVFHVPLGGGQQATWTEIPKVDVFVGNPPYVRQEKIDEYYGKGYKKSLQGLAKKDVPGIEMSGRSDVLCYFFTHGFAFLKEGGYIGLLTSSTWLDTEYGFELQKLFLGNFEIVAILESWEPWFIGARVTTAVTILHHQPDAEKRNKNLVKFVYFKKSLSDFLSYNGEDGKSTYDQFRDFIESLTAETETDEFRIRVMAQSDLYGLGITAFTVEEDDDEDEEEEEDES